MAGRLSNVIRRGGIYYFRRSVPPSLRECVGKIELIRSLSTNCRTSARLRADHLFVQSETIFSVAAAMFPADQLSAMVRDFYSLVLEIDDYRRWFSVEAEGDATIDVRSDFLRTTLLQHKEALIRNDFDKIVLPSSLILARHNLAEADLKPGEMNQLRHALLRASVDLINDLLAR